MLQTKAEIQSFPSLPADFKDAADLVQAQLKESIASLDIRIGTLEREHSKREWTAIALKVVSVVSSLVVLSGVASGG